ncbi:hypothetical protein K431DRAFT_283481 [Polychaeton citri CBS 116435]|uniref:Uncharacterized protein n=1 Tax=Polychaeton citri CBS 116435 TaxID=1314669 RepID=A0A9P4Q9A5_9PEZI|nr:hypothetical protein K431DRAFT_283481 [Polychaeton citri CBS 116435]
MSYYKALITISWFLIENVGARTFESRDAEVRSLISQCVGQIRESPRPSSQSTCQATLGCILNTVDSYTAGRWSAGASILAFIPTITGLLGNSIDEIVLVAEESMPLAILISLCSVTAFSSRFGSTIGITLPSTYHMQTEHFVEELRARIKTTSNRLGASQRQTQAVRWALRLFCGLLLSSGCAAIWYTVEMLYTNGVVIISCPYKVHVLLWVGLTQLLAIFNILLKRWIYNVEHIRDIALDTTNFSTEVARPKDTGQSALPPWQQPTNNLHQLPSSTATEISVVLRCKRGGCAASLVKGFTSLVSFALYAFSTALLGSMTLIPASDAIRSMALMCASVGLGRIIAGLAMSDDTMIGSVIVADVPEQHWPGIKRALRPLTD